MRQGPNSLEERARWRSRATAASVGTLMAGKNSYPAEGQVSNEVAIHTDWVHRRRTCS